MQYMFTFSTNHFYNIQYLKYYNVPPLVNYFWNKLARYLRCLW